MFEELFSTICCGKLFLLNEDWTRPINRAPLGHTRFYCQGVLFPWADKTRNQFPIQFFTISRLHYSKWFGRYINHISDHALELKQTMNRPLIPDSYPFLLPNSMLWSEISSHIGNLCCACAVSQMRSPGKLIEYS